MTCDAWLNRALLENTRPKGFFFTGTLKAKCCIYLSDKFRAKNEIVSDLLKLLAESTKLKVTKHVKRMLESYDLESKKGPRAQPWRFAAAIAADDADRVSLRALCDNRKNIVFEFDSFVAMHSKIDREWCLGRWCFGASASGAAALQRGEKKKK